MRPEEVRRICNRWIKRVRNSLFLNDWRVDLRYERCDKEHSIGECVIDFSYKTVAIRIDPDGHKTEEGVLDTLRHELLHVQHAEVDLLRDLAMKLIPTEEGRDAYNLMHHTACERLVGQLEDMLDIGLEVAMVWE